MNDVQGSSTFTTPSSGGSALRQLGIVPFAVALGCYLLPFMSIGGFLGLTEGVAVNGLNLLLGGNVTLASGQSVHTDGEPVIMLAAALTLGSLFTAGFAKYVPAAIVTAAAIGALGYFRIALLGEVRKQFGMMVQVEMGIGWNLAMLCLLVGLGLIAILKLRSAAPRQ